MSNKCISNIWNNIYVSDLASARNGDLVKKLDIGVIVSCLSRKPRREVFPSEVKCYHFPLCDHPRDKRIIGYIQDFCEIVRVNEGKRVLVHCRAGISRSASIVVGYLITCEELNFSEAIKLLRRRRSCVKPNYGFEHILRSLSSPSSTSTSPQKSRYPVFPRELEMNDIEKVMCNVGYITSGKLELLWNNYCLPKSKKRPIPKYVWGMGRINGVVLVPENIRDTKRIRIITVDHLFDETDYVTSSSSSGTDFSEGSSEDSNSGDPIPLKNLPTGDSSLRYKQPELGTKTNPVYHKNRILSTQLMHSLCSSQKVRIKRDQKSYSEVRSENSVLEQDISFLFFIFYTKRDDKEDMPTYEQIDSSVVDSLKIFYDKKVGHAPIIGDKESYVSSKELLEHRSDHSNEGFTGDDNVVSSFIILRRADECSISRSPMKDLDIMVVDFEIALPYKQYFFQLPRIDIISSEQIIKKDQKCVVACHCGDFNTVPKDIEFNGFSKTVYRSLLNDFFRQEVLKNEKDYKKLEWYDSVEKSSEKKKKEKEKEKERNDIIKPNPPENNLLVLKNRLTNSINKIKNYFIEYLTLPFFKSLLDFEYQYQEEKEKEKEEMKEKYDGKKMMKKLQVFKNRLNEEIILYEQKIEEKNDEDDNNNDDVDVVVGEEEEEEEEHEEQEKKRKKLEIEEKHFSETMKKIIEEYGSEEDESLSPIEITHKQLVDSVLKEMDQTLDSSLKVLKLYNQNVIIGNPFDVVEVFIAYYQFVDQLNYLNHGLLKNLEVFSKSILINNEKNVHIDHEKNIKNFKEEERVRKVLFNSVKQFVKPIKYFDDRKKEDNGENNVVVVIAYLPIIHCWKEGKKKFDLKKLFTEYLQKKFHYEKTNLMMVDAILGGHKTKKKAFKRIRNLPFVLGCSGGGVFLDKEKEKNEEEEEEVIEKMKQTEEEIIQPSEEIDESNVIIKPKEPKDIPKVIHKELKEEQLKKVTLIGLLTHSRTNDISEQEEQDYIVDLGSKEFSSFLKIHEKKVQMKFEKSEEEEEEEEEVEVEGEDEN